MKVLCKNDIKIVRFEDSQATKEWNHKLINGLLQRMIFTWNSYIKDIPIKIKINSYLAFWSNFEINKLSTFMGIPIELDDNNTVNYIKLLGKED